MDWKSKFSSILRETEANLSKARHRYQIGVGSSSRSDWRPSKYPLQRSTSLLDLPFASTPKCIHQNGFSTTESPVKQLSTINPIHVDAHPESSYLGQSLQDRIDQQNRIIEQLTLQVQRLEKERDLYNEQFRDLKSEICRLGTRIIEKQSSKHSDVIEQHIEQLRQEMRSELLLLRNDMKYSQTSHSAGNIMASCGMGLQDMTVSAYTKDVVDAKNNIQSKIDAVKQDMELLKGRLVTVEADMATHLCNELDKERERLRTERITIGHSPLTVQQQTRPFQPRIPTSMTAQQQIEQLRSTVILMKKKLENMELNSGTKRAMGRTVENGISQRKEELFPSSDPEDQSLLSDSETSSLGDYLSDDLSNSNHDRISSSSDVSIRLEDLSLSEDDDSVIAESIGNDDRTSLTSGGVFQSDKS
ncbi:hypothetical protein ScPMuIL_000236 [Solemya velum]